MKVTAEIELTPAQIAACMEHMSDDDQAQVIIELAALTAKWDTDPYGQWYAVGRHLVTCSCATKEARDLIDGIHHGVTAPLSDWETRKMRERGIECPLVTI